MSMVSKTKAGKKFSVGLGISALRFSVAVADPVLLVAVIA